MFLKSNKEIYRHLLAIVIAGLLSFNSTAQVKENMYDSLIRVEANSLYKANFTWAIKNGKWGIFNSQNKLIVPCEYDIPVVMGEYYSRNNGDACLFQTGNPVIMLKDSLYSDLIDLEKGIVSPPGTRFLKEAGDYFVFSRDLLKYGLLSRNGKILIPEISETCILPIYDSLFLIKYDKGYALHDRYNKVKVSKRNFSNTELRNAIHYFIKKGVFRDKERFEFDHLSMSENDLIPALMFLFETYKQYDSEWKKVTRPEDLIQILTESRNDPFCYIDGCFRYLDAYLEESTDAYQVDLDCDMNIYTNKDQPLFRIRGLGNGIIEYCYTELEASMIRVYRDISWFRYLGVNGNSVVRIGIEDLFPHSDRALKTINLYMDSLTMTDDGQILSKIDPDERIITGYSNFSIDKDGIYFWLLFDNEEKTFGSTDDQFVVHIPFERLENHIPKEGWIQKIRRSVKDD